MNELILANLLFQAGAGTALMLVAGISAARQLHSHRSPKAYSVEAPTELAILEGPAARVDRPLPTSDLDLRSKAA